MLNRRIYVNTPDWAEEEMHMLANEWMNTDTELGVDEYVRKNASDKLKEHYRYFDELMETFEPEVIYAG